MDSPEISVQNTDNFDFLRVAYIFDPDKPEKCAREVVEQFRPDILTCLSEESLIVEVRLALLHSSREHSLCLALRAN